MNSYELSRIWQSTANALRPVAMENARNHILEGRYARKLQQTGAWPIDWSLCVMKLMSFTSHHHHRVEATVRAWRAAFSEPLSDQSLSRSNCLTFGRSHC
jgi:hypothetical protein